MSGVVSATCVAPINIAVIKYWGKENDEYNIPLNSSLSVTFDVNDLCAKTTVAISEDYEEDHMTLNGREENIKENERLQRCLRKVRTSSSHKCHINSSNNFPTAAGLASSAAGYACLARCLGTVYSYEGDLTVLARLGSGSACRSMHGGFVKWVKGSHPTGEDSKAFQIADQHHWPELNAIIVVVSHKEKSVGSTKGMKRSVETSDLLKYRAEYIVPKRIEEIEKAIIEKDFETFAEVTMKDSNQLHAICQDSYPPLKYMSSTSHQIVHLITKYNSKQIKAGYTFDAGSNAVIFTLDENFGELLGTLLKYFPCAESMMNLSNDLIARYRLEALEIEPFDVSENVVDQIICTKPGEGASVISTA